MLHTHAQCRQSLYEASANRQTWKVIHLLKGVRQTEATEQRADSRGAPEETGFLNGDDITHQ